MRSTQHEVPVERHRMPYRWTYQAYLNWDKIDFTPSYSFENDFVQLYLEVINPFTITEVYIEQNGEWKMGSLSFSHLMTPPAPGSAPTQGSH